MTVNDLIDCAISEIWITFREDPTMLNGEHYMPDIRLHTDYMDASDVKRALSDDILNHEINLICAYKDAIYISLDDDNR